MKRLIDSRGTVIIETAIIFPLIIIAVLTIGFIMKLYITQEYIQHVLSDEVGRVAEEAYLNRKVISKEVAMLDAFKYQKNMAEGMLLSRLKQRFSEEDLEFLHVSQGPDIIKYQYLFDGRHEEYYAEDSCFIDSDDLIEAVTICEVKIPFPIQYVNKIYLMQRVIERGWTGSERIRDPMDFDKMSEQDQFKVVYVFPRAGERYHEKECLLITNYPIMKILTNDVKEKYDPCKICNAKQLQNGANVYVFEESGEVFHSKDCPLADKYIISMEIEDAKNKGYTPCKKCKPTD